MSHLIAGIDESLRPRNYLMCATVVSTNDRAHVRQALRGLLLPNQRRLHFHTERDGRRRMLLKAMTEIDGIDCHLVIGGRKRDGGREKCLRELVNSLLGLGVRELTFEQVDRGTAKIDERVMDELLRGGFETCRWGHEAPQHEPLLWISDAVASAYGAGGEWRRAVEPLTSAVRWLNE